MPYDLQGWPSEEVRDPPAGRDAHGNRRGTTNERQTNPRETFLELQLAVGRAQEPGEPPCKGVLDTWWDQDRDSTKALGTQAVTHLAHSKMCRQRQIAGETAARRRNTQHRASLA